MNNELLNIPGSARFLPSTVSTPHGNTQYVLCLTSSRNHRITHKKRLIPASICFNQIIQHWSVNISIMEAYAQKLNELPQPQGGSWNALHLLFRNTQLQQLTCLAAFPQFPQFNVKLRLQLKYTVILLQNHPNCCCWAHHACNEGFPHLFLSIMIH